MKIVLLAGGLGSRLAEETTKIPKPMVEVGGKPIIVHVMDIYSQFEHADFIVAAGYKSMLLKQYFSNFHLVTNDITVSPAAGTCNLTPVTTRDWRISVVDTGALTMTGGRLGRLRDWIGDETFMVTYSDGVGDIDIDKLLAFHRSHGKIATVTAVQPPARFGNLELDETGTKVCEFTEKVRKHETWINGGFFVFEPGIFDFLSGDTEPLEQKPLTDIARAGELMAFRHYGFWHPMDTIRDRQYLDGLCNEGTPPWITDRTLTDAPLQAAE